MAGGIVIGKGFPAIVFNRATSGSSNQFNLENESGTYNGSMILQAVGHTTLAEPFTPGTITAFVADLEVSLDGGTTWNKLVTPVTLTTNAQQVNVGGCGAGVVFRLTSTTFTLGTASFIAVYAATG